MEEQLKKHIIQTVLLSLLIFATICFIFSNSMETIPESSAKSEELLRVLSPALEFFVGDGNATNHLIRKLAHFTEFFVLGIELCWLFLMWGKPPVWPLLLGLCTALMDETIQIFYERGSQVQDVWLDFSAIVAATIIAYLFNIIMRRRKERLCDT